MAEKKSMFYVAIFVLMILSISLVDASSTPSSEMRELGNINIAMWHGRYANPLTNVNLANGAVLAVKAMFEWMGCTVSYVNTLDFLLGLEGYDVLLVPGYPTNALLNQLTIDHINNINDFVAQGGIFIGICGGAALGCTNIDKGPTSHPGILNGTTEMDLFTGLAVAPIYDYDSPCMITLNVNTSSLGPDLSGMNSSYTILYNYGPYFHIDDWTGIHILARYSINNNPAIISLQKDRGCVLLIGPHPEFEENSDRDAGGTWDNIYDDPDSEWILIKNMVQWCVDTADPLITTNTSTTESTTNTTTVTTNDVGPDSWLNENTLMISAASIGVVVVLLALVLYRKR